jgi:very-short-patch-repair endonuclease
MLCDYGCGAESKYFFKSVKKWCCSSHVSKCPAVKKKVTQSIKSIYKDKNSVYNINKKEIRSKRSKSMTAAWKNKTSKLGSVKTREKQRKINLQNREKGIYSSPEYKKKLSLAHKKIWQDPNSSYNSLERSEKISKRVKELYKDNEYLYKLQKGLKAKPNKAEKSIYKIIHSISNKFEFVGDLSLWIGGKNPDFINKEDNKIIELFGDYWHSKEMTGISKKEHMMERETHFKKFGYSCLIVWESELVNNKQTINKIKTFCEKEENINEYNNCSTL